jgi:hypothetical protein
LVKSTRKSTLDPTLTLAADPAWTLTPLTLISGVDLSRLD